MNDIIIRRLIEALEGLMYEKNGQTLAPAFHDWKIATEQGHQAIKMAKEYLAIKAD